MAYERDRRADAPCWLCGGRIDYDAPPMSPDAWEPDHVLTVDEHPECQLDLANIRPSHASCNRSRGAADRTRKLRAQAVGQQSRRWL